MAGLIPFGHNNHIARSNTFGEIGDFMNNFFRSSEFSSFPVDIKDKKDHYEVEAELPGLHREMIDLSVEDGYLTISANQQEEKESEQDGYVLSERRSGQVSRSFALNNVDEQKVTAEYKDGILKIILPKTKEEKPNYRKIEIR